MGLASCLAVVTLALWITGRLALYINPDSAWFAGGMSVLVLIGTVLSFTLPPGAEADHGHDHGNGHGADPGHDEGDSEGHNHTHPAADPVEASSLGRTIAATSEDSPQILRRSPHPPTFAQFAGVAATVIGGAAASAIVLSMLLLPPASLSAQLAMSRDVGAPPLFAGADAVALASTGDTSSFGIGAWASAFATSTNPGAFDGDSVTLTGFVTPASGGTGFQLTRLVITHCVIDAQPASVPIAAPGSPPGTGQWVTVTGTIRSSASGGLVIVPTSVSRTPEPKDPYEY